MGSCIFSKLKIEPNTRAKILQAIFSAAPDTPWSSSDLGLDDPIEEEALRRGSVLESLDSIVVRDLGDDSGSDDDLTIEAKRVMRERKRDKQQLEKLGTLTPIVSTSTEAASIPVSHQRLIKF